MKIAAPLMLALTLFSQTCIAGGVALSATRVIYNGEKKEVSLSVQNKSQKEEFLIQSWIDDATGNKRTPFIITPPLFRLDPNKNNILRIVNVNSSLPQDRESVYWVNVKAIPSKSEGSDDKNTLQIAVRTRVKLFYRPAGLQGNVKLAPNKLLFTYQAGRLHVENPTPYNLTFSQLFVNGIEIKKTGMVLAKSTMNIAVPESIKAVSQVKYSMINDFGSPGEMLTHSVN